MLTEEMFKQRAPNYGDILYKSLKNLQQGLKNPEKGKKRWFEDALIFQ